MIKILMFGCNGRMGQAISSIIKEDNAAQIAAGVDVLDSGKNDYPVYKNLAECREEADVIIDFSTPSMLTELLEFAIERKLPIVLCTTGYTKNQMQQIKEASLKIALLRSANMSIGVNLLLKVVQAAAKVLAEADFDIEIVEKHHNQKLDAPSGTAVALADAINEALDRRYSYKFDRTMDHDKRGKNEIGIASVRGGNIVGEHEIIFAGTDEVIELKHTAYSKVIFAKGAIQAAKFLAGKTLGYFQMNDVIEASSQKEEKVL